MKTCAIYKIINTSTNIIYIGRTRHPNLRFNKHIYDLRKNKHANKNLQEAFNINGEDCFKYEILEMCEENEVVNLEKKYINDFKAEELEYGYNATGKYNITFGNLSGKRGRPKLDDDAIRSETLLIRVTKQEKAEMIKRAKLSDTTLSRWVREKVLEEDLTTEY